MPRRDYDDEPSARPLVYLLLLAFGVALGLGAFYAATRFGAGGDRPAPPVAVAADPDARARPAAANGPLDADENEANAVFEGAKASVVNVDTVAVKRERFSERLVEQQTGSGSGFFWDADGRIVTNFHVVQEFTRRPNLRIRVVLADRSAYEAELVGAAPDMDLAVVRIDPTKAKTAARPLGVATSADLKVGQRVYAIGNPFGLSLTLTSGIVSALDRGIEAPTGATITGAVQHTAPINPGNSGGPLLNRAGKLVGVNTSITAPSGAYVGIGFAIPSDAVNQVVTNIIQTGRSQGADLGVKLYDEQKLRRAGYETGVMVSDVEPTGPAAKAGLRGIRRTPGGVLPGDIIVALNDERIDSAADFQRAVAALRPGARVRVRFLRNDAEQDVVIVAGAG